MGAGIHGDGVPNNCDRTQVLRIPLCVLPSSKNCQETLDAILEVVARSFRHLLSGCHPESRHDGTPWRKSDAHRAKKKGDLGFNAALVEVRGELGLLLQGLACPVP